KNRLSRMYQKLNYLNSKRGLDFARHDKDMTPALAFFPGLGLLVLFGWYFATDVGLRKRLLATTLVMLLVAFSIATIWPPKEKITLGLDIQGGTSFLIRLMGGDKDVNKGMLDQAVEVIRKRIDYFGV